MCQVESTCLEHKKFHDTWAFLLNKLVPGVASPVVIHANLIPLMFHYMPNYGQYSLATPTTDNDNDNDNDNKCR